MRNEVLWMLPQTVQIALTGIPDAQIEELIAQRGQYYRLYTGMFELS